MIEGGFSVVAMLVYFIAWRRGAKATQQRPLRTFKALLGFLGLMGKTWLACPRP